MTALPERLRAIAGAWRVELVELGNRPRLGRETNRIRYRDSVADWRHREAAIAGAVEMAAEIEQHGLGTVAERARRLRAAGLTFEAIGRVLGIPTGSVKNYARRQRMTGGAS